MSRTVLKNKPLMIDHDSTDGWRAALKLKLILLNRPELKKVFNKNFKKFYDSYIYRAITPIKNNRCKAGFQPTEKLLKFIKKHEDAA